MEFVMKEWSFQINALSSLKEGRALGIFQNAQNLITRIFGWLLLKQLFQSLRFGNKRQHCFNLLDVSAHHGFSAPYGNHADNLASPVFKLDC